MGEGSDAGERGAVLRAGRRNYNIFSGFFGGLLAICADLLYNYINRRSRLSTDVLKVEIQSAIRSTVMKKETVYKLFSKIPTLETERLTLRRMKPSDSRDMFEYASKPEVTRYLLWEPHQNQRQTQDYLEYLQTRYRVGDFYDWALVDRERSKMIGTCGFTSLDFYNNSAEVGYVLNPEYWGRGIACEALCEVLKFAFMELNIHRVEAKYIVGNDRSRRVMEKCGMSFEGVRRSSMFIKGSYRDIGICSILSEEYINKYL